MSTRNHASGAWLAPVHVERAALPIDLRLLLLTLLVLLMCAPAWAGGRRNLIQNNQSFDERDGSGTYREPKYWRAKWPGDSTDNWWWTITSSDHYGSYNGTCGWSCDHDGKMGIRTNRSENLLICQDGCNCCGDNQGKMSKLWNDSGTTRLVAKAWRKTCRNNTWVGWIEADSEWQCSGTTRLGENTSDNAEGDQEHKDWMSSGNTKWVGGAVGVHEGGWDSNGRLTMFDDYWLSFELAGKYLGQDIPSELWAGESSGGRYIAVEPFGWDNFGHRSGDWRMKTNNEHANNIMRNTSGGNGSDCQTSVSADNWNWGRFYFTAYGYGAPSGDSNASYSPEVYFRRVNGDDLDCVKWDDNPDNRQRQLRISFNLTVKGHQPEVQSLAANQININTVRLSFNGHDRKGENVTFNTQQYKLGAGGTWTNATCGSPTSTNFTASNPAISMDWSANSDLGGVSRSDVYFRIRVNDAAYQSNYAEIGPFAVNFDATPPSVTINQAGGQSDPTNSSPISFTVAFSESVQNFATGDVTLGGTAGATTATVSGSGANYTVSVSGMTQSGTVIASLAAGVCTDLAGNANTASTSTDNTVTYDVTQPDCTISKADADPTGASAVTFAVNFTEAVTGLALNEFTLAGTAPGKTLDSLSGSGSSYTVEVTGISGSGTVSLSLSAGTAQDTAGNTNTAGAAATYTIDQDGPTVTVNQAGGQGDPASTLPITFNVVFSEAVADFATGDVTMGGTATGVSWSVSGSGTSYTISVTAITVPGTVVPSLTAGVAHDGLGNASAASSSTDNSVLYAPDPAPTPLTWGSVKDQGDAGEMVLALDPSKTNSHSGESGPTVEPRRGGPTLLRIDFSAAVMAADGSLDVNDITLTGSNNESYNPDTIQLTNGSTRLELGFDFEALPNGVRYTINLAGALKAAAPPNLALAGDTDCQVRVLLGDVSGSGNVGLSDASAVKMHNRDPVTSETARFDLNGDGRINLIDAALARSRYGQSAP